MKQLVSEKKLRKQIESKGEKAIFGAEKVHQKDSFHYLRSGLDQITLKIAKKKNKTIGFSFEDLRNTSGTINQAKLLARMQQNRRLCQKFKVKTQVTAKSEKIAFDNVLKKK